MKKIYYLCAERRKQLRGNTIVDHFPANRQVWATNEEILNSYRIDRPTLVPTDVTCRSADRPEVVP